MVALPATRMEADMDRDSAIRKTAEFLVNYGKDLNPEGRAQVVALFKCCRADSIGWDDLAMHAPQLARGPGVDDPGRVFDRHYRPIWDEANPASGDDETTHTPSD